jgi:hypothetical protein
MKTRWVGGLVGLVFCGCVAQIGEISSRDGTGGSGSEPPSDTAGSSGTGTGGSLPPGSGGSSGNPTAGTGGSGSSANPAVDAGATPLGDQSTPYCKVRQMLTDRCVTCHTDPPIAGAPMPLVAYSDLLVPAISTPSMSVAELAFQRIQSTSSPMPPPAFPRATTDQIQALRDWIAEGTPQRSCTPPTGTPDAGADAARADAGRVVDAGRPPVVDAARETTTTPPRDASTGPVVDAGGGGTTDPFAVPSVCTSNTRWTSGNNFNMRPGEPCLNCHGNYAITGTVYPTGHEPNDCNGVNGSSAGATVVITDATGATRTLNVNPVGNFELAGTIATPFRAKVVSAGRERVMNTPQTNGNCNSCHTQNGTGSAPGRIVLP